MSEYERITPGGTPNSVPSYSIGYILYPYRGVWITSMVVCRVALFFVCIDRWAEVISYVPCSTTGETMIRAELTSIDGAGGTWARAKPLQVWHERPTIAITGVMEYDVDDMDFMEGVGVLEGVAIHEMGHAVGIGYVMHVMHVTYVMYVMYVMYAMYAMYVMYAMLCSSSSNSWIGRASNRRYV